MLAEKEGIINNITNEKASLLDEINSIKDDNKILNKKIEELEIDIKNRDDLETKRIEEEKILDEEKNNIKDFKIKIQILEYSNKDFIDHLAEDIHSVLGIKIYE